MLMHTFVSMWRMVLFVVGFFHPLPLITESYESEREEQEKWEERMSTE